MFGLFTKKEPEATTQEELSGKFYPILDVAQSFSYVYVKHDGKEFTFGMKTETVQEAKIALEEIALLKSTVQALKKEFNLILSEYRQSYNTQVANRGAILPIGGKWGRYMIRASRASDRGSYSSTVESFKNNSLKPLDQLLLGCDKFKLMLKKDIMAGN